MEKPKLPKLYKSSYTSPIGEIILVSDGIALHALDFVGQKYYLFGLDENSLEEKDFPIFDDTKNWLDIYFSGKEPDFTPKLQLTGSPFRQLISKLMLKIPYGQTSTYGSLAKEAAVILGKERMSAQAVGGAVSHNPISIIVPCHRVLGSDGSLTGYAGGIERKIFLLSNEKSGVSNYSDTVSHFHNNNAKH